MLTTTDHSASRMDPGPSQSDRLGPSIGVLVDTLATTSAPQWDAARCRQATDAPIHLFFSDDIADINQAKRICSACPMAVPCVQGALDRHEPCGVWGGYLFANGQIVAHKRPRGRPPKNRPAPDIIQLTPSPISRPETGSTT